MSKLEKAIKAYNKAKKSPMVGKRCQLHPATDLWMMGARYGTIVKDTGKRYLVCLDRTCTCVTLRPEDVCEVFS